MVTNGSWRMRSNVAAAMFGSVVRGSRQGGARDQRLDVGVHEEEVGVRAAEHADPEVVVGLQLGEQPEERTEERHVEELERRSVDRHDGDPGLALDLQGSESWAHRTESEPDGRRGVEPRELATRGAPMRAVRSTPPGVAVVDVDEPDGPGELISIRSASICASDFMYIQYGSTFVQGHELAGVTEDGRAVAIEAIFGCGDCEYCDAGEFNLCATTSTTALGMMVDGGMSEWFRAPARSLVPLPDGLAVEDACLVEPTAVAWHACRLAGVGPETRVAVVGGGAIGLMAVASARAMGAAEVSLEARYPHQIELGERLGATTPSGLYDVVIEAAGSESALHRSAELARPHGTMGYLGVYGPGHDVADAHVLHQGAADGGRAGLLQARARSRLRGRGRAPRLESRSRRRADHAPLPHRGRGGGLPRRVRQERRCPARHRGAVVMSLTEYFHVGIVVPDLEAARARFTELLGVEWGPVMVNDIDVRDGDGVERVVPNKICYSTASPYLELIEEVPGTPVGVQRVLEPPPHRRVHHGAGRRVGALQRCAVPARVDDGRGDGPPVMWAYHRDPLGVRIEIVNDELRPLMEQYMWRAPEAE